jgi:hypothetical protein
VLLTGYGNVPAERAANLIGMLLGMPVSAGFVAKASARLDARLQDAWFDAPPPTRAQHPGRQLAGQPAQFGTVDRLIDRLVHDAARRLIRELAAQRLADLLRAPPLLQPLGHEPPQHRISGDLTRPRPGTPPHSQLVRGERPVLATARIPVPAQLTGDRRRTAAYLLRDRPDTVSRLAQIGDPYPLLLRQVPVRDLPDTPARPRGDHSSIMQLPAVTSRDCAAVSPPFPGPPVDPDDPARLRVVVSLRDQPRILLALLDLRQHPRSPAVPSQPRTCRVLRRPLETAAEGFQQPKRIPAFTPNAVSDLLRALGIQRPRIPARRPALAQHEWWRRDLAVHLGMPEVTLDHWVRRGWATGYLHPQARLRVVRADPAEVERLRALHLVLRGQHNRRPWLNNQAALMNTEREGTNDNADQPRL